MQDKSYEVKKIFYVIVVEGTAVEVELTPTGNGEYKVSFRIPPSDTWTDLPDSYLTVKSALKAVASAVRAILKVDDANKVEERKTIAFSGRKKGM